ncbi:echinoderm microtubule-associated protein-like 2 isoform X5 [Branchiostoma floridae]|uniref:Echinoderm microtubule-associated protein-like 2 isoform X5 n=1 Tax=Branchiostoma floridae TaxID=7739 RepID=A0A9J7MKC3_BRAFL|nr:echinoderm microtubule-associated protein-like 2 isoform X5 [Branchiostoma floridae]
MEIDGNQSQNDLEHELREQLRGPLEDVSRQRLRAVRMALRRHGNVDSRISQKDFLTVFQENGIKISSRLLSLLLHRFENQFGVDYENMWKLMYDTQHTTGRDSVMAKNASNENSTADKLDQSFHNSADLKLVERIKTQFAKSGDEFDLEEFRDELKVRDRGHTTTLSKKEMKKAVAEMQVPIYGNVMNALMKRCDDECNGQISWPEFLRFLTAARDSLARGDDGTDLNASGSKLWNTGTSSTRTSTGEEQKKMSTVSSGPRLIEGTPYSESPRPSTPQSLGLKRNSMPAPKASSVSPRKARSMASETLRGYDGSSSGTEDSRKRRGSPIAEETHRAKSPDSLSGSDLEASMTSNNSLASLASKKGDRRPSLPRLSSSRSLISMWDFPFATAENSSQNDSPEVKQEEEAKNLTRRESTVTITSVNMSNKDEEAAPKKKGMFGSMKKFFGSKSKPKKEEIPIETIKEPEKPKEPEVPPPDGKPVTVNIRGTDLDVYIPDRYWYKPVNHKYPEHKLSLDWVYGYRGNDCRNNLFPLASGEVVYFTGTVTVIYDHLQCRQRHYMEHTGEIRSIAVHPDKVTLATGQTEVQYDSYSQAHIRIWDSRTLQTQKVLGTGALENAVIALTFSGTLDRLVAIDSSEGHMMSVWDIKSGRKLTEARVDTEVVCQAGFSPRSPDTIVTAGKEHLVWWELGVETGTLQEVARANYDQRYNKAKYIICFVHNERGDLITGDSNGTVFVWGEGGNNITQALKHIHEGPVFSLLMMKNFLLTAGRDGMVFAFPWGKNMEHTGFSASLQVPRVEGGIRMQCVTADGAVLLLGTTVNSILSAGLTSASCPLLGASLDKDVVTQGHFDDVKAICPQPSHAAPGQFVTAGNDGTVCMHDSDSHILQWKFVIKGATIQCADYYHPGSLPRVALGTKDGSVIVLEANDLDEVSEMCRASKIARGRITVIKICPDGDRIAIGCQDGSVQILQLTDYCSKLELLGKCKGHKGAITGLDWSADLPTGGYIIQTSSSQYQHFLWDVDQCVQLTDMAGLRNTEWLTYNCILGYVVKDIWNAGLDGRDVRTLDRAPNWRHVGTADERGEIHIFTYPCAHKDAQADTYKCHSSQVSCLRFLHDNVHLVTAGGKDTSILLWKIVSQ